MPGQLDFLGALKWPSILAITLLPAASYVLDWRDHYLPERRAAYGPAVVGSSTVLLTHDAEANPLHDATTRWCIHLRDERPARLVDLAYGGSDVPEQGWVRSAPGERCVTLARGASDRLWLRLREPDGAVRTASWTLDGPKRPAQGHGG